LWA
jgi:hypothetical protein